MKRMYIFISNICFSYIYIYIYFLFIIYLVIVLASLYIYIYIYIQIDRNIFCDYIVLFVSPGFLFRYLCFSIPGHAWAASSKAKRWRFDAVSPVPAASASLKCSRNGVVNVFRLCGFSDVKIEIYIYKEWTSSVYCKVQNLYRLCSSNQGWHAISWYDGMSNMETHIQGGPCYSGVACKSRESNHRFEQVPARFKNQVPAENNPSSKKQPKRKWRYNSYHLHMSPWNFCEAKVDKKHIPMSRPPVLLFYKHL